MTRNRRLQIASLSAAFFLLMLLLPATWAGFFAVLGALCGAWVANHLATQRALATGRWVLRGSLAGALAFGLPLILLHSIATQLDASTPAPLSSYLWSLSSLGAFLWTALGGLGFGAALRFLLQKWETEDAAQLNTPAKTDISLTQFRSDEPDYGPSLFGSADR